MVKGPIQIKQLPRCPHPHSKHTEKHREHIQFLDQEVRGKFIINSFLICDVFVPMKEQNCIHLERSHLFEKSLT